MRGGKGEAAGGDGGRWPEQKAVSVLSIPAFRAGAGGSCPDRRGVLVSGTSAGERGVRGQYRPGDQQGRSRTIRTCPRRRSFADPVAKKKQTMVRMSKGYLGMSYLTYEQERTGSSSALIGPSLARARPCFSRRLRLGQERVAQGTDVEGSFEPCGRGMRRAVRASPAGPRPAGGSKALKARDRPHVSILARGPGRQRPSFLLGGASSREAESSLIGSRPSSRPSPSH